MLVGRQPELGRLPGSRTHLGGFQDAIVSFGVSGDAEVTILVPTFDVVDSLPGRGALHVLVCHVQLGHHHPHLILLHRSLVLQETGWEWSPTQSRASRGAGASATVAPGRAVACRSWLGYHGGVEDRRVVIGVSDFHDGSGGGGQAIALLVRSLDDQRVVGSGLQAKITMFRAGTGSGMFPSSGAIACLLFHPSPATEFTANTGTC